MNANQDTAIIRKALKSDAALKNISIKHGRGTAYGYVEISGSIKPFGYFTDSEKAALKRYGIEAHCALHILNPDDRIALVKKLSN